MDILINYIKEEGNFRREVILLISIVFEISGFVHDFQGAAKVSTNLTQ